MATQNYSDQKKLSKIIEDNETWMNAVNKHWVKHSGLAEPETGVQGLTHIRCISNLVHRALSAYYPYFLAKPAVGSPMATLNTQRSSIFTSTLFSEELPESSSVEKMVNDLLKETMGSLDKAVSEVERDLGDNFHCYREYVTNAFGSDPNLSDVFRHHFLVDALSVNSNYEVRDQPLLSSVKSEPWIHGQMLVRLISFYGSSEPVNQFALVQRFEPSCYLKNAMPPFPSHMADMIGRIDWVMRWAIAMIKAYKKVREAQHLAYVHEVLMMVTERAKKKLETSS